MVLFLLNHRDLWKGSGLVQREVLRGIKDHLLHDVIDVLLSLCIFRNNEAIGGPSAFHFRIRKLSEISGNVETQNSSDLALKSSSFSLSVAIQVI